MSDILATNLAISEPETQDIDISKEKTGNTIEPEICIEDNTKIDDGVICYV